MNFEFFIAKRLIKGNNNKHRFTQPIINIAVWGIALGVVIMLMAVSITTGYQKEITNKLTAFSGDIQIASKGMEDSFESNPLEINTDFISELKKNSNIQHFQFFAHKPGIIKTNENMHGVILKGVDKNFNWEFFKSTLVRGETIDFTDKISQEAIISEKISSLLDLNLGDQFRVFFVAKQVLNGQEYIRQKKHSFIVKGIYNSGLSEHFDNKFIFVDIERIKKINQWDSLTVGGFEIFLNTKPSFLNNQSSMEKYLAYEDEIIHDFYSYISFLDVKSIFSRFPQIMYWLDYINMHIYTVLIIILVVSIVNMSSALLIIILEKTNMIGILKAIGCLNASIRKIFIYQAAYLIGKGVIYGNIIALLIAFLQNQFHFLQLDPDTYYIKHVSIFINPLHWIAINILTIFICSFMLIIPSLVISKISPVKAIKFN